MIWSSLNYVYQNKRCLELLASLDNYLDDQPASAAYFLEKITSKKKFQKSLEMHSFRFLFALGLFWCFLCLPSTVFRQLKRDGVFSNNILNSVLDESRSIGRDFIIKYMNLCEDLFLFNYWIRFHRESYYVREMIKKIIISLDASGDLYFAKNKLQVALKIVPNNKQIIYLFSFVVLLSELVAQKQKYIMENINSWGLADTASQKRLLISSVLISENDVREFVSCNVSSFLQNELGSRRRIWKLIWHIIIDQKYVGLLNDLLPSNLESVCDVIVSPFVPPRELFKENYLQHRCFGSLEKIDLELARSFNASLHLSRPGLLYKGNLFQNIIFNLESGMKIIFGVQNNNIYRAGLSDLETKDFLLSATKELSSPIAIHDGLIRCTGRFTLNAFSRDIFFTFDKKINDDDVNFISIDQPNLTSFNFIDYQSVRICDVKNDLAQLWSFPDLLCDQQYGFSKNTTLSDRHKKNSLTDDGENIALAKFLNDFLISELGHDEKSDFQFIHEKISDLLKFNREYPLTRSYLAFTGSLEKVFFDCAKHQISSFSKVQIRQTTIDFLRLGYINAINELLIGLDGKLKNCVPHETVKFSCEQINKLKFETANEKRTNCAVISAVLWGESHAKIFCDVHLASLLAPDNMPFLNKKKELTYLIICDYLAQKIIIKHKSFSKIMSLAEVKFVILPSGVCHELRAKHLHDVFYISYGLIDHIGIEYAKNLGADLYLLPIDSVLSERTLKHFNRALENGFEVCGGGNIVASEKGFIEYVHSNCHDGVFIKSVEEIALAAQKFPHQYFLSQLAEKRNVNFGKWPREIYLPRKKHIEIRSVFIHPLAIRSDVLKRYDTCHFANVDYGMIPNIVSDEAKVFLTGMDSDAYLSNFCDANRSFKTESTQFTSDIFLRAHENSHRIQRKIFKYQQLLPTLNQYEPLQDINEIIDNLEMELESKPKRHSVFRRN